MVFSSLVFLFVFLVIHLVVYAAVAERHQNVVLLVSSLIFYSWGGPQYLLLLVGDTFASWLFALLIERAETPSKKRLFLVLECVVLLGSKEFFEAAVANTREEKRYTSLTQMLLSLREI